MNKVEEESVYFQQVKHSRYVDSREGTLNCVSEMKEEACEVHVANL